MPVARISLFVLPVLLGLFAAGCGNGSSGDGLSDYCVRGVVTYKRPCVRTDDGGRPAGLDSSEDADTLPLRDVTVRAVWRGEETMPDGRIVEVWRAGGSTATSSTGYYYLDLQETVADDTTPVYVEVQSVFHHYVSETLSYDMRVIADPDGVDSRVPQADKVIYSIRKGLDGSAPPDSPTPAAARAGKTVLNFEIGLDDRWWVGQSGTKYAADAVLEGEGTGSRVAAIIDTAHKAAVSFGNPTLGGTLDIHYRRGVTEPLGTYVEYDLERLRQSPGSTDLNYRGSVRGGPQHDDAWDEGALLSMMARNNLRLTGVLNWLRPTARRFPGADPRNQLLSSHLQPTVAVAEGLPEAMAAVALGTPYITYASGTEVRDVRDLAGLPSDVHSGPAIAAFVWDLALKMSGIAAPGGPADWKAMDPYKTAAFYSLGYKSVTEESKVVPTYKDLPSLFTQMSLMSSFHSDTLTEPVMAQLAAPFFGAIWPRPDEGPLSCFLDDWGDNPDSGTEPIPGFSLSMSDATPDAEGRFSNLTAGENHVAKVTLSMDTAFWLAVSPAAPMPDGASIEVRIVECRASSDENRTTTESELAKLSFGRPGQGPQRVVLRGNAAGTYYYLLFFSLNSPTARVPDTFVDVRLDLAL